MKFKILLTVFFVIKLAFANDFSKDVERLNWDGIEVTWIKDNRFPTYNLTIYFADGAIADGSKYGLVDQMFDMILAGTNRFTRQEIADNLEYFGVNTSSNVVHEYSSFSVSGLSKDLIPTMKKVCHLFSYSTFPEAELKKDINAKLSDLKNITNNPGALSNLAFRQISLAGSPFVSQTRGTLKSLPKISTSDLKKSLEHFNKEVKKKIYITGPKNVLNIKNIVTNDCGWNTKADFERTATYTAPKKKQTIHLVTVPKANQAQVVVGKYLSKGEFENFEALTVTSEILGGGFTSLLMDEIRVKRGLTYSVGVSASGQKEYGRSVIRTFTKEETVNELIQVLDEVLSKQVFSDISEERISKTISSLKGAYPFGFEKNSTLLSEIMFLDHIGVDLSRLFDFEKRVSKVTLEDFKNTIKLAFPIEEMDIVVLGEAKLASKLKKLGNVKIHSYKDFL